MSYVNMSPMTQLTLLVVKSTHPCERDLLSKLLQTASLQPCPLQELEEAGLLHEADGKLHLAPHAPDDEALLESLKRERMTAPLPAGSLASAVYAFATGEDELFLQTILQCIQRLDAENRPLHIFYVYNVFAYCFRRMNIPTENKEFCSNVIRIGTQIQEVIHLYPFNSEKELQAGLKLRDMAQKIGDQRTLCYLDLQIGAMNINLRSINLQGDYLEKMKAAKDAVIYFDDADIILRCSPLVMLYYFLNGEYDDAINFFYRTLQISYTSKSRHYNRLFYLYAFFSALNKGNYEMAREFLQWGKSEAIKAKKVSNIAAFDAHLAYLLIVENKCEEALQIIDDTIENEKLSFSSYGGLIASRLISLYQYLQGNLRGSYASFISLVAQRSQGVFHTNYLSFYFVLDLLGAYALAGLPPIKGFEIEKEVEFALNGPSRIHQGVAYRVKAELMAQAQGWQHGPVREYLEHSLAILSSINAVVPLTSTYWALSRYHSALGDAAQSRQALAVAYTLFQQYHQSRWPDDLHMPEIPSSDQARTEHQSLSSFCIKLLKRRSVHGNTLSMQSFFYEMLSTLLSTMEMVAGEVYRVGKDGRETVACINYVTMTHDESAMNPHTEDVVAETLERQGSALYFNGNPLVPDGTNLSSLPDSTRLSLCLYYAYDSRVQYVFALHGSLRMCRNNVHTELVELLDNFIRPEIESFFQTRAAHCESVETHADARLMDAQEILYCSKEMAKVVEQIDNLAGRSVSILILGESGVGKELVARRLHQHSGLKGEFVPVNISSIPNELFESELFGYERGSFTGASQKKTGLFELADKGTLFLDEIGDAPYALQVKLLRVIQEKEFMRVGGLRKIHSNFRLVSATNKNLTEAMASGDFREDFFYRLNAVTLHVPPLRERKDDIPFLARRFRQHYAQVHGLPHRKFSEAQLQQLLNYEWPGNVRQLRHFVENYCLLHSWGDHSADHFPLLSDSDHSQVSSISSDHLHSPAESPTSRGMPSSAATPPTLDVPVIQAKADLPEAQRIFAALPTFKELEEKYFEHVYAHCNGVVGGEQGIAAVLGISRATTYTWIERLKLTTRYKKTVTRLE